MVETLRILRPFPHIAAFYDGRIEGYRHAPGPNWVDDGAVSVGIASYAILSGQDAIVYDTHVSMAHARAVREWLAAEGVERISVVLSHWHLDHIAGNAVFADCEIIANRRTADHLKSKHQDIEAGTLEGPPPIAPLVHPNRLFDGRMSLSVGPIAVELISANIHSDDATLVWLPQHRILLAGDTMEDTVTYVGEPQHFDTHLADLDRLWAMDPRRILPNHGCPDIIAAGGYAKTLVRATQQYIRVLKRCRWEPELARAPLREVIAGPLDMGWVTYFEPYEDVHRSNVGVVLRS
jgi:glyoxylase-like metal-dependent hydrolase (beta-lactamase superfamily II)